MKPIDIDRDKFVNALRDTQKYDYWLWPEFFVNDELQNLKQQVNSLNLEIEPKEFGAEGKKSTKSFTFEFKDISKLDSMIRLKKYITYINECHFGYSIYEYSDFDLVCYNTYEGNLKHEYKWHIDRASNVNVDFKYTVLSNISDNYTGGEFLLNSGGDIMKIDDFKPGAVLMFRSNVQHKVNPVLSGTRKTLSFFVRGPRWK